MTSRLRMASRRWLRAWRPRRRRSSRSCSSRCSRSCRAAWRRRRRWTMPSVWSWRACCASKPVPAPPARPIHPMRPMRTHAAPSPVAALPARPGRDWTPYWFAAPVALYLLLFQGYPLVQELYLSFTSTALLTPEQHVFVGLQNYIDLVTQEDFRQVLLITAIYTVVCVVAAIALGLGAALLLDAPFRGRGLARALGTVPWAAPPVGVGGGVLLDAVFGGRGLARALVTIPWAAPPVAVALIFVWIYNGQYGIFNHLLGALGGSARLESWLDSPALALPAVLLTTIWQIFPFATVVILAALQGVSSELREAAVIDGAHRLSVFRAVVWPSIQPSVALLALFLSIWSLRRFDLIWLMTQGGPIGSTNTLVIELYRRAFVYRDLGQGAAVGMVGLSIALLITVVYFRHMQRAGHGKTVARRAPGERQR